MEILIKIKDKDKNTFFTLTPTIESDGLLKELTALDAKGHGMHFKARSDADDKVDVYIKGEDGKDIRFYFSALWINQDRACYTGISVESGSLVKSPWKVFVKKLAD